MRVALRPVTSTDVDVFFRQQQDPEANAMASFPARDAEAHHAHWRKILAEPANLTRTIVVDGSVAGNVVSFDLAGQREVGYWIGREFWGRGIATAALMQFLEIELTRPLHGVAVEHNVGSIRVLTKCGFVPESAPLSTGDGAKPAQGSDDDHEVVLVLR